MFKTRAKPKELFKLFQREGVSQNEAGRRAGLSVATMSKVMNGEDISQKTGKKLCEAFGVDPDEILEIVETEGR